MNRAGGQSRRIAKAGVILAAGVLSLATFPALADDTVPEPTTTIVPTLPSPDPSPTPKPPVKPPAPAPTKTAPAAPPTPATPSQTPVVIVPAGSVQSRPVTRAAKPRRKPVKASQPRVKKPAQPKQARGRTSGAKRTRTPRPIAVGGQASDGGQWNFTSPLSLAVLAAGLLALTVLLVSSTGALAEVGVRRRPRMKRPVRTVVPEIAALPLPPPRVVSTPVAEPVPELEEEAGVSVEESTPHVEIPLVLSEAQPVVSEEWETCVIEAWRGYSRKYCFYAKLRVDDEEDYALAESPFFRSGRDHQVEPTEEALAAHDAVVAYLLGEGWELVEKGDDSPWYEVQFRRPGDGVTTDREPQPIA